MRMIGTTLLGIVLIWGSASGFPAQAGRSQELPEKYRIWLEEDAAAIISPMERDVFLKLVTDKERDLFIDAFWRQRDPAPATEENEFRTEHYRRLKLADSCFSSGSVPGRKTEWGKLYIIAGRVWPILKLFEGMREDEPPTVKLASTSFLHPLFSASLEAESDIDKEGNRLKEIFNLKNVRLIAKGLLGWPEAWPGRTVDHTIELDGRIYVFRLIPKAPGSRLFGVNILEQDENGPESVLDTEIVLPSDKTAVFGFQAGHRQNYFFSVKVPPATGDDVRGAAPDPTAGIPGSSPPRTAEDVVRISGDVRPPQLKRRVAPEYPEAAKQARVEGLVMLNVRIDEKGRVEAAEVIRSIPLLDAAAVEAVRQWRYQPFMVGGKARKAEFSVSLRFYSDGKAFEATPIRIPPAFQEGAVLVEEEAALRNLVKYVPPTYSEIARQARVEGFVVLGVRIDEKGQVESVIVLRSIPLLEQSAIEAVRQWGYRPTFVDGAPRKCVFAVTVRFKLI
jgi:TonB family protein